MREVVKFLIVIIPMSSTISFSVRGHCNNRVFRSRRARAYLVTILVSAKPVVSFDKAPHGDLGSVEPAV